MNIQLFVTFIILNALNVIIQTVKSIATVKCGKVVAAFTNAIAYGLYTVVVVYMVCELPLWLKALVIGLCNLVGVFVVKLIEERIQKDKLWKVEMTVPKGMQVSVIDALDKAGISFNSTVCHKWALFNCYCSTKQESHNVREIGKKYGAKFFAAEGKVL